jgi:hypothetical protein
VKHFIVSILFLAVAFPLTAQETGDRILSLHGLRIYEPSYLSEKLSLKTYLNSESAFNRISAEITNFYHSQGYSLVTCYLITDTAAELSLYVDEGNLGKIIFKGLDDITLIRAKFSFSLDKRIYHKPSIELELENLKRKYSIDSFDVKIEPSPDYDKSFVQLGIILKLPFLPAGAGFPFFERYGYRYNLICTAHYNPDNSSSSGKRSGFTFSASLFYLGIKPKIKYNYPGLFLKDDIASTYLTCGVSYFEDRSPGNPPSLGYIENGITYRFPQISELFSPGFEIITYYSSGSRADIGIDSYRYIYSHTMFDPSFSLTAILKFFPGFGFERYRLFSASFADELKKEDIKNETKLYAVGSLKTQIEHLIFFLSPAYKRSTTFNILFFKNNESSFRKTIFTTDNTFSGFSSDIYTITANGTYLSGKVPFYHDEAVSGGSFKGFTGKGYFSKRIFKAEFEYKTSLHRGYIFFGPFIDGTAFDSMDSKLPDIAKGICGGIAGHLIFFDQFEFSTYFGRDYLFSKKESAYNLLFNISKNY